MLLKKQKCVISRKKEREAAQDVSEREREGGRGVAEGGREGKLGGRDRHREGISGAVLGLRLVSVADGYLWIPLHCGIGCWTGSGWDVGSQAAEGVKIEDEHGWKTLTKETNVRWR